MGKNYYLDTSALFKLYHDEAYAKELNEFIFRNEAPATLIISQLAILEFTSTVWKKLRDTSSRQVDEASVSAVLAYFDTELTNFFIVELVAADYELARRLLNKCNASGKYLRTMDALHCAVAVKLDKGMDLFITSDRAQANAANFIGLPTAFFGPPEAGTQLS